MGKNDDSQEWGSMAFFVGQQQDVKKNSDFRVKLILGQIQSFARNGDRNTNQPFVFERIKRCPCIKFVCCLVPRSGVSFLSSQQRRRVETTSKLRRTGFLDPSTFSKAQKSRVLAMANIRQPVNEFFSGKKPSKMSTQFKTWLQTCLRWRSMINDMASTRDNMLFAWSGPQQPMLQG